MIALCDADGTIVSANREMAEGFRGSAIGDGSVIALSTLIDSAVLQTKFQAFINSAASSESFSIVVEQRQGIVTFYRMESIGRPSQVLLNLVFHSADGEHFFLLETGRLTSRLIHDFKNQVGGLKLYAAYLKKRFSSGSGDLAEELSIIDKINSGLNAIAEQSSLVSKLTRPIELKRQQIDAEQAVAVAVNSLRTKAESRAMKLEQKFEGEGPFTGDFDLQQLSEALKAIISRAIEITPESGEVTVRLSKSPEVIEEVIEEVVQIEVIDQGENLSEGERLTLFDFLTNERINRTSLEMALAHRIIVEHGGEVFALPASPAGTVVRVRLPN